jgi:hypothetical protein
LELLVAYEGPQKYIFEFLNSKIKKRKESMGKKRFSVSFLDKKKEKFQ